jgi:hypothetical protein
MEKQEEMERTFHVDGISYFGSKGSSPIRAKLKTGGREERPPENRKQKTENREQQTSLPHWTMTTLVATPRIETALDWFERCQRQRKSAQTPHDPSSAAWTFIRSGTSGIAPVDAAWRNAANSSTTTGSTGSLPVVAIDGPVGKTWSLISLAARFVVATRPSRFETTTSTDSSNDTTSTSSSLPQVVILDSNYDITASKVAYVVRSTLLRQPGIQEASIPQDLECCLSRIHIATVDDLAGWVPVLETMKYALQQQQAQQHPTLVLWDGYLSESTDESQQKEVERQLTRLLACNVALVVARNQYKKLKWETQRIRLERHKGKDCVATVDGTRIPFSLSLGGILS